MTNETLYKSYIQELNTRPPIEQIQKMVLQAAKSEQQVLVLIELIKKEPKKIADLASWILTHVSDKTPEILNPFNEELTLILASTNNSSLQRNIARTLSNIELPKKQLGTLLNSCFSLIETASTAIAVKAHCMGILYRITKLENDIIPEFKIALEELSLRGSKGEQARARNILKKLG